MADGRKICPSCGNFYDESQTFCMRDGTALVQHLGSSHDARVAPRSTQPTRGIPSLVILILGGVIVAGLAVFLGSLVIDEVQSFRLRVYFDEGYGLSQGDNVYVKGNRAGTIVDARFEGEHFVTVVEIRDDAARLLTQTSIFYATAENRLTNKKCLAVFTDEHEHGVPLRDGDEVKGVGSLVGVISAVRIKQFEKMLEEIRRKIESL